jgi:hypothetical protein
MILKISLLLLSIIFLIVFIFRVRSKVLTIKIVGKVTKISESFIDIKQQYYNIKNFYPIILYEYYYEGKNYIGKTSKSDIRRYMVPEIDKWGMPNKDSLFFWRELKVGGSIPIAVKVSDPSCSIINIIEESNYKSENLVFLILFISFFALFCWV